MNKRSLEVDENEIMLVDKPAGISSFGVVARVRRKLSEEAGYVEIKGKDGIVRKKRKKVKVGHTGTLDPFATGLLILLIGRGTKRANEFLKLDKEYIAKIKLGEISDTGDVEGNIVSYQSSDSIVDLADKQDYSDLRNIEIPSRERVEEVVKSFVGEIEQRVPNYSAVKINGQRAYKLAREGKQVEMPVRKVKIYGIGILDYQWPYLEIKCEVSSGTYIRALGEDIGKKLKVGGYLTELRRTKIDKYSVDDAAEISL